MIAKQKILIVDDSMMNREILSEILSDEYDCLFAVDGEQAVEVLSSAEDVALMLLDIHMPKMDGFDVLKVMHVYNWIQDVPVIIISAEEDASYVQKAYELGATDYINRPFNVAIVQRRIHNTLLLNAKQKRLTELVEEQIYEREKNNSAMLDVLSHVIETRSFETGAHILHVRMFTSILLRKLQWTTDRYPMSEDELIGIINLSALHDIGKINVPTHILNKPDKLDEDEWVIMKSHTTMGDMLMENVKGAQSFIQTARDICRYHHERWDGKGYPDGLKGDEIPISAQVVAMADVLDALVSDRCYRKAIDFDTAIAMIQDGQCGAFNPILLKCLKAARDELHACYLSGGVSYDYQNSVKQMVAQMIGDSTLLRQGRNQQLLTLEKEKARFFAEGCGGIQFEYDALQKKTFYRDWRIDARGRILKNSIEVAEDECLISDEEHMACQALLKTATPENPVVQMNVHVLVDGEMRLHNLRMCTLWSVGSHRYVGIIGQLVEMDGLTKEEKEINMKEKLGGGNAFPDRAERCVRYHAIGGRRAIRNSAFHTGRWAG